MVIGRQLGAALALGCAVVAMAYGAYLLVVGPEVNVMTPDGGTDAVRSPTLAGLVPLAIGLVAEWAAVRRRTKGLWAAAALAAAASALFLFSYSLQFALLSAVLLLAAALSTLSARAVRRS